MTTLTPQQRQFLAQRLKVKKPEKKGFFSRATADEKSDQEVRKYYEALLEDMPKVEAALARLDAMVGKKPAAQVPVEAFRTRLAEIGQLMEKTDEHDAAAVFQGLRGALANLLADIQAALKKHDANPESKARGQYAAALAEAKRQLALLQVTPNAQVKPLSDLVAAAEQSASPDTEAGYRQALKVLGGCAEAFKSAQSAAVKAQKADIAQMAKKPDALLALGSAALELEAMQRLPGCEADVDTFSKVLEDARKLAENNRFADALEELKKLKSLPSLTQCEAKSKEATRSLKDQKAYQDGTALLEQLRQLVTPADHADYSRAFQAAVKAAVAPSPDSKGLAAVVLRLQGAFDAATQAKVSLVALQEDIEKAYGDFARVSSKLDVASVDSQREAARLAHAARDYTTASRLAAEVFSTLRTGIRTREPLHAEWLVAKVKLTALAERINTQRESAKCEAVRVAMVSLLYKVVPSEVQRLTDAADWPKLVSNVAQVERALSEARVKEAAFSKFDATRAAASKAVADLVAQVGTAIQALKTAVIKGEQSLAVAPFKAGDAFKARLQQIETLWNKALASATNDAELQLQATKDALAQLGKDVADSSDGPAVDQLRHVHAQQLAQSRFEVDWAVLQAEIVQLQAVDNQAAVKAAAEAQVIRQGGRADWHAALAALATLKSRVADDRAKLERSRDAKAAAVAKAVKAVQDQIDALKRSTRSSKFGPFFETLQQECDQLELLAKSSNGDAVDEAGLGLQAMQDRIKKFIPDTAAPANGPTLDNVAAALADSESALKKITDDMTENCPKTLARLTKELAALRASLARQAPEASMAELSAFDAACAAAKTEADKVVEVREEYTQLLPSVKAAATQFSKQKSAPDYAKSLEEQLAQIVKQAKNPDELYAALQKLNALDEELKQAAINPASALAKEGQIREKKKADAAAEAEWKRSLKLFEDQRIAQAQAAVKAGGSKGLIDELKNMLKAAKETAGKGDHAEALKQLQLADQRVDEIMANPQGASIGARNNLPADTAQYARAIERLRELLGRFPGAVAAAMPGLPQPVATRVGERVSSLLTRLDATAFDVPVQHLIAPGLNDAQRRGHREEALAAVRSMRNLFRSHPLMASLARSPVATAELSAALRRVDNSLDRLDANISRSCA